MLKKLTLLLLTIFWIPQITEITEVWGSFAHLDPRQVSESHAIMPSHYVLSKNLQKQTLWKKNPSDAHDSEIELTNWK